MVRPSPDWLFAAAPGPAGIASSRAARHTAGVASIVIEREAPIPALALTLWLQAWPNMPAHACYG